jgi:hypothetical protein
MNDLNAVSLFATGNFYSEDIKSIGRYQTNIQPSCERETMAVGGFQIPRAKSFSHPFSF